jgi:tetratricopeptide (TPR) repeat protein
MATVGEALTLARQYQHYQHWPQAEEIYRQVLETVPSFAEAWRGLGAVCQAQGKLTEAAVAFRQALQVKPQFAEALHDLGIVLSLSGQHEEAAARLQAVVSLVPGAASARNNLGIVLGRLGRLEEAAASFREAIRLNPNYAEAYYNLGKVLLDSAQESAATQNLEAALRLKPDYADAHNALGLALQRQARLDDAIPHFQQALRLRQDYVEAYNNLGFALAEAEQLEPAEASLRAALQLEPTSANTLNNLGIVLNKQERFAEAVPVIQQAIRVRADFAQAHNNLGIALLEEDRYEEAVAAFREALRLKPDYAEACHNIGQAWRHMGRIAEALACYEDAIRLGSMARLGQAQLWLLRGDYEKGWPAYEARYEGKGAPPRRTFYQPEWDGSDLQGRTILLHAEQGHGDMIQFLRYVPLVKQRGATVVVDMYPKLFSLAATCPGIDQLILRGLELPSFDCHVPMMSLPRLMKTTLATIPADIPYLSADPKLVEYWANELKQVEGFKIGIVWQGYPKHTNDRRRSMPLARLLPLARIEGVRLISLQVGPGSEQLQKLPEPFPGIDLGHRFDPESFADAAAAIKNLDLVVSVDSALAHLAGALGLPVWLALPFAPEFRWLLNREDTPWYPTMRLFRQKQPGNWDQVVDRMGTELKKQAIA